MAFDSINLPGGHRIWNSMSFRALCGVLAIAVLGACGDLGSAPQRADPVTLLATQHGVIVILNPASCTLMAKDAGRLNALADHRPLSVTVIFQGLQEGDTVTARRAMTDLGLTVPVVLASDVAMPDQWYGVDASLPLLAVVRHGSVQAVISGLDIELALNAVHVLLGVTPPPERPSEIVTGVGSISSFRARRCSLE